MGHINELQLKLRTYLTLESSTYHTVHHVSLSLSYLVMEGLRERRRITGVFLGDALIGLLE